MNLLQELSADVPSPGASPFATPCRASSPETPPKHAEAWRLDGPEPLPTLLQAGHRAEAAQLATAIEHLQRITKRLQGYCPEVRQIETEAPLQLLKELQAQNTCEKEQLRAELAAEKAVRENEAARAAATIEEMKQEIETLQQSARLEAEARSAKEASLGETIDELSEKLTSEQASKAKTNTRFQKLMRWYLTLKAEKEQLHAELAAEKAVRESGAMHAAATIEEMKETARLEAEARSAKEASLGETIDELAEKLSSEQADKAKMEARFRKLTRRYVTLKAEKEALQKQLGKFEDGPASTNPKAEVTATATATTGWQRFGVFRRRRNSLLRGRVTPQVNASSIALATEVAAMYAEDHGHKPSCAEHLVEFSEKIGSKVAYSVARHLLPSRD